MSIKVMSMVFDRYPSGGMERLLALAMADHASDDGRRIWPSVDELARKTMQSRSSVQRQIRRMVAIGWLIQVRSATGRPGITNEYRICPEWIEGGEVPTPETGVNLTPLDDESPAEVIHTGVNLTPVAKPERGVITAVRGVTRDERGVTAMTPESSEPSLNQSPLPPGGGASGFDELFSIYPNHDNRAKAERRYRRLAPNAALQQTMRSAIEDQRLGKRWTKDDGEFVPEFATWLRNERWRDETRAAGTHAGTSATSDDAWQETRSGIDAKARALGLTAWDEAAFSVGRGENYMAFTARVKRAAAKAGEAVCA
jgi:hypothetical protein